MDDNTVKATMAMGCITALTAVAMFMGIDGILFAGAIAALAGLGGYELKVIRDKRAEAKV